MQPQHNTYNAAALLMWVNFDNVRVQCCRDTLDTVGTVHNETVDSLCNLHHWKHSGLTLSDSLLPAGPPQLWYLAEPYGNSFAGAQIQITLCGAL